MMQSVDERISDGSLGWTIRRIVSVKRSGVTLNDGTSFSAPCLASALPGDIWAVNHEPAGHFGFGQVRQAVLLAREQLAVSIQPGIAP